jgi:hypothetical protein
MSTRIRIATAAALAAAVALGTAGCGTSGTKAQQPYMDAPKGTINKQPMDIVLMSDGFANIGSKCDGPNRVYVIFHKDDKYGSVAVAPTTRAALPADPRPRPCAAPRGPQRRPMSPNGPPHPRASSTPAASGWTPGGHVERAAPFAGDDIP